jgi:hypothetical protein
MGEDNIDAQVRHRKGHDNRPNEGARTDKSLQGRALCLIQFLQSIVQLRIIFIHTTGPEYLTPAKI